MGFSKVIVKQLSRKLLEEKIEMNYMFRLKPECNHFI